MRRIRGLRRWLWAGLGGLAAAWLILGFTLPIRDVNINDIFNGAALFAFGTALLFVVIYTVAGILVPARKWWRDTIATLFVLAAVSLMLVVGPTAFAVLFHHGLIDTWWWAWAWVGGHIVAGLVWAVFCWMRLIHPLPRREGD